MKDAVQTAAAPAAVGAYSQAVRSGGFLFVSGQIPLDPASGEMVGGGMREQIARVFANLAAVCEAAGAGVDDIVKLTVYLTDLSHFALVNEAMEERFARPFPARAAVGVAALPKGATVEAEAIVRLPPGGDSAA